jgi:hypothetical protein
MERPIKRGFNTREAAAYVGFSASWLRKKRMRGALDPGEPGPVFVKTPSGAVLYLREQLDEWLDRLVSGVRR